MKNKKYVNCDTYQIGNLQGENVIYPKSEVMQDGTFSIRQIIERSKKGLVITMRNDAIDYDTEDFDSPDFQKLRDSDMVHQSEIEKASTEKLLAQKEAAEQRKAEELKEANAKKAEDEAEQKDDNKGA